MTRFSRFFKLVAVFMVFILAMLLCRMIYSESLRFIFLVWNLFLAFIPYQLSAWLVQLKPNSKWYPGLLLAVWLLFFPNALYIITDLIHLQVQTNVPVWYDAVLLFTSALAGLLMAFASLHNVEIFIRRQLSYRATTKLVVGCLFLGSFGVYLGRFLRWNSWDIISNPWELAGEIGVRVIFPLEHYRTWGITLLLTILFSLLYFTLKNISGPVSSEKEVVFPEVGT